MKKNGYKKSASVVYAAIQQQEPLQQDANMATNWRKWKTACDNFYFLLTN